MRHPTVLTHATRVLPVLLASLLLMVAPALAADANEPNDDAAHATAIGEGTFSASIDTGNDYDYYAFTTTKPFQQGTLTFDTGSHVSFAVESNDSMQSQVVASDSTLAPAPAAGSSQVAFPFHVKDPGQHYIIFQSSATYAPAPYTFKLSLAQPAGEPNDTADSATPVSTGSPVNGEVTVDADVDTFSFQAPNDNMHAELSLTLDSISASVSGSYLPGLDGTFLNPSGSFPDGVHIPLSAGPGGYAVFPFTLGAAGTSYARISSFSILGTYHFSIALSGGTPPAHTTTPTNKPAPTKKRPSQSGPNKRCLRALGKMRSAKRVVKRRQRAYRRHPTRTRRLALSGAKQRVAIWRAFVRTYC